MAAPDQPSPIGTELQEAFLKAVDELRKEPGVDHEERAEALERRLIETAKPRFIDAMVGHMHTDFGEQEEIAAGFEARNLVRWREGWVRLSMFVRLMDDLVQDCLLEGSRSPEFATPSREVVVLLATKAARVGRECIALLRAGYPDGAMGRWRTLYETAVVAEFISRAGDEVAEKYLARLSVSDYLDAKLFTDRVPDAQEFLPAGQLEHLKAQSEAAKARFGDALNSDWGWTKTVLKHDRILFTHVEDFVEMSHWRPFYKRANRDVHASHQDPRQLLGMSEAPEPSLLGGASNSGMVEPSSMVAHALKLAFRATVRRWPNLDRVVLAETLEDLHKQLVATFEKLETETLQRWREQEGAGFDHDQGGGLRGEPIASYRIKRRSHFRPKIRTHGRYKKRR